MLTHILICRNGLGYFSLHKEAGRDYLSTSMVCKTIQTAIIISQITPPTVELILTNKWIKNGDLPDSEIAPLD